MLNVLCQLASACADMDWRPERDWLTYHALHQHVFLYRVKVHARGQYRSGSDRSHVSDHLVCLSVSQVYKLNKCRAKPSTACWKAQCQREGVEHSHAWGRDNADSYAPWLEECRVWRRLCHSGQEGRQRC